VNEQVYIYGRCGEGLEREWYGYYPYDDAINLDEPYFDTKCMCLATVFAQSDAAATVYFIEQFCAASI
jgi:hypothetical protein